MTEYKHFDPQWRDDFFDEVVFDIPLLLPTQTAPDGQLWVAKQPVRGEEIFGEYQEYKKLRIITAIVKRNPEMSQMVFRDSENNVVPKDSPVYDFIFPPKAWMSNNAEELSTMYYAAKEARGDILVGGLGLAIFPQIIFYLQRPVNSITIIEENARVIEIITDCWLNKIEPQFRDKITLIESSYEDYAASTESRFDMIYLDLWEDSDPRFLAYINFLVNLSEPLCKPEGFIRCWGYNLAVKAFVKQIQIFERDDIDIAKIPQHIDPTLLTYALWRNPLEGQELTSEMYEKKAQELAETVAVRREDYDRNRCFSPFTRSRMEAYQKLPLLNYARRHQPEEEPEEAEQVEAEQVEEKQGEEKHTVEESTE